jgi:putative transposase
MNRWLVGSGIPRRTSCASYAEPIKELREQSARLKRLLAEAELEKDALREVAKGKF